MNCFMYFKKYCSIRDRMKTKYNSMEILCGNYLIVEKFSNKPSNNESKF